MGPLSSPVHCLLSPGTVQERPLPSSTCPWYSPSFPPTTRRSVGGSALGFQSGFTASTAWCKAHPCRYEGVCRMWLCVHVCVVHMCSLFSFPRAMCPGGRAPPGVRTVALPTIRLWVHPSCVAPCCPPLLLTTPSFPLSHVPLPRTAPVLVQPGHRGGGGQERQV